MAIVGIETNKPISLDYIVEINKNLRNNNLVKNPFKGEAVRYGTTTILDISPIYLNFPIGGFIIAGIITLVIQRFTWVIVPFVVVGLFSYLWTGDFFYIMFKIGLKKKGYKLQCTRLKKEEIIRRLLHWAR